MTLIQILAISASFGFIAGMLVTAYNIARMNPTNDVNSSQELKDIEYIDQYRNVYHRAGSSQGQEMFDQYQG